tara:strand:+ start:162 stop:509 length:348 start_codon:yes stop_codon:yes gene_type:complete
MENQQCLRGVVGVVYVAYLVSICVFWGVQEVVMGCLGAHILGVLIGLYRETNGSRYTVYPFERPTNNLYFFFDIVQFIMLVACSYDKQLTEAAAVVAIVGVVMCFIKVGKDYTDA